MSSSSLQLLLLSLFFFSITHSLVPSSQTFRFVNSGEFGPYVNEYAATYRPIPISNPPFQFVFYNTTPNEYTLALRIGNQRQEPNYRFVWEANRGFPADENATLTFSPDGNLLLADSNGVVRFQTQTTHKNVTGLKLLKNGNLILHDAKGKSVWESFDFATDTLLVGQALKLGAQLTSRVSNLINRDGPYKLIVEPKRLGLYYYYEGTLDRGLYYSYPFSSAVNDSVVFDARVDASEGNATELVLETRGGVGLGILTRPKYDATYSYLQIGLDGNIRLFTYNTLVGWGPTERTFKLFGSDDPLFGNGDADECNLPERCGEFGLCEQSQCVACPGPSGMLGWSRDCKAPKLETCKSGGSNESTGFYFYKLVGVEHFSSRYDNGDGPMGLRECRKKCETNCECKGYFYDQKKSLCWMVPELMTLTRTENSTRLGFIKAPVNGTTGQIK